MSDDRGYMDALSGGTDAATPPPAPTPEPSPDMTALAGSPNPAALNTLAAAPSGAAATPQLAPAPTTGLTDANGKTSLWRNILAGVVVGSAAGLGTKTPGQAASAGVNAELGREQRVRENDLAQQQNKRAEQEAQDAHQAALQRSAYNQTQLQIMTHQLHLLEPGSPEYVAKFVSDQANATDEAVKAGARVLFTADSPALVQQKLHDEHFNKGDFEPQLQAIHDAQGNVKYAAVVYPDAPNSQPLNLTYTGADGKPVTRQFAPGTVSLKQWNQVQLSESAKNVDQQFDLYKQKKQEDFQRQQTATVQGAEDRRALLGKAIDQGAVTVGVGSDGKIQLKAGQTQNVDGLGVQYTPVPGGLKEQNKIKDSFKKDADNLAKTEGTFNQFQDVLNDIDSGKGMNGAQSVVALFNAIGISAEPLQGKGFRINNNTVEEHANARGLGDTLYQKLLKLKNGDVITPQQVRDYADIAMRSRHDAYVNKINEARSQGIDPSFLLPRGNGRKIDKNTASIFIDAANNNPTKAAQAMDAAGWKAPDGK